jgi:mevalonate kinase
MSVSASAPGKIILFGEHAVVYGQPALAAPVTDERVQATATILPSPFGRGAGGEGEIWIDARDLGRRYRVEDAPPNDPLAAAVRLTFFTLQLSTPHPSLLLTLRSSIPIASGLGSGAAICTALVRALAAYLNSPIANAQVSAIVFETEKLLHGTPSGIDNTVIAYGQPVFFIKGQPPEPFHAAHPFRFLIGDTGLASPTRVAVGDVRAAWEKEPKRFNALFAEIGAIARQAREIIETAMVSETVAALGRLMDRNHALLREINVSCPELEALVGAARGAGAPGAKLSGGGRGGNMIALVTEETEGAVRAALEKAGAKRVIATTVGRTSAE